MRSRKVALVAGTIAVGATMPIQMVESGGRRMPLARLYHEGSSYPARAALPGLAVPARPALYLAHAGPETALPRAIPAGGAGVLAASEAWRTGRPLGTPGSLSLERLATLLHHAQGISSPARWTSGGVDLRMAASAGALYPVNLYVAASGVEGLAPGFYYYHPGRSALVRVRTEPRPVERLGAASGAPGYYASAPAALVFTVTFARTAFKYAERAYRYVAMDTGHAAYNLAVAAAATGWRAPLLARFDDRAVEEALGLDPSVEAPLLLVPLAERVAAAQEPRFAADVRAPAHPSFVDLVHGGTSMRVVGGSAPLARHPAVPERAAGSDVALPAPAPDRPLLETIRARRSVRTYLDRPVSLAEVSLLLASAAGDRADPPTTDPLLWSTAPLRIYAVARRVEGLAPGVYRYLPAGHALRLVSAGERARALRSACLDQDSCGAAAVVFVQAVRWEDLSVPDGDRGYRYATLRAGVGGEGLYLAATALGLGPCGVGAFVDGRVAALLGIDPAAEVPLFLTAVGRR